MEDGAFNQTFLTGKAYADWVAKAEVLAKHLIQLMRATGMPNGLAGVGYDASDLDALAEGTFDQQRLIRNSPKAMTVDSLRDLFSGAMNYW